MGGGGPGKIGQEKDKAIYDMVIELLEQTGPIRDTVFAQGAEALTTGTIEARQGEVRRRLEQAMTAASEDKTAAREALATRKLDRTPTGQAQLANVDLEGKLRTSLVEPEMMMEFLRQLAPALTGQAVETAIGGEASLADAANRASINQRLANTSSLGALIQGVGQLGAAGIQAGFGGGSTPPPITASPGASYTPNFYTTPLTIPGGP